MDAERIAGYQGTGHQGSPGPQKTTEQQGTGQQGTGHWDKTAAFAAVPDQRGEPREIGEPDQTGRPEKLRQPGQPSGPGQSGNPGQPGQPGQSVEPGPPGGPGLLGEFGQFVPAVDGGGVDRVDVRCEPLVVRDGCSPDRIPAGRWPSDRPLVRSEQFAVNEAIAPPGLFAVHAPPGTGVAEVFGDLVAAIITERARRIADLPSPAAAFGESRTCSTHRVATPNPALTGFEIVLAAPESSALTPHGLPPIGAGWRDAAAAIDYFASTARLSDGVGAWAMLAARLGDGAANRAFAERWWHGAIRGTDVLFPTGDSMAAALRRLSKESAAVDWPGAVARFRAALAKTENLAMERAVVAASITRISDLEQACEEASCLTETAQARLAEISEREPSVRARLAAAEEEHRARLADLGAHELGRPAVATVTGPGISALRSRGALSVAVAGGLRRGKNWRHWSVARRQLRAACADAEARRDAAAAESAALYADRAAARSAVTAAAAEVTGLTAQLGPLAEAVAAARQRWGDHVPDGPAQAETEDTALIEWRETSAPWADEEYATSRAEVFLAALDLHKTLITAQADVFAANLGALMDLFSADRALVPPQTPPAGADETQRTTAAAGERTAPVGAEETGEAGDADGTARTAVEPLASAIAAAWQSLFLVVPVVHVPFGAIGPLFAGCGPTSLGWLLADHAERVPARQARAVLGRINHAVLAGDTAATATGDPALAANSALGTNSALAANSALTANANLTADSAQRLAERTARYGTWLRSGSAGRSGWAGRSESAGQAESAGQSESAKGAGWIWVGTPLRVVRGLDRATIDRRNDLVYDGLLVSDRN